MNLVRKTMMAVVTLAVATLGACASGPVAGNAQDVAAANSGMNS